MISHVDIIGALVYRTREALNKRVSGEETTRIYQGAKDRYKYYEVLFDKTSERSDLLHLWHFPGTQQEILETLNKIGKSSGIGGKLTFPSIFNYQSVIETHGVGREGLVRLDYDLVISAPVDSSWTTEQRNRTVHKYVLEPIYEEFMNQITKSGWFQIPMSGLSFTRMKIFSTGNSMETAIRTQYGWYFDSIQLSDFKLMLNPSLCFKDKERIEREAELVTDTVTLKNK